MKLCKNYINGEWVDSVSGKTAPTYNPATGEVLAEMVVSTPEDVDLAVAAARTSFYETRDWRDMDSQTRGDILLKIAEQLPHDGIELRYLYVSRRSLMVPYLRECRDEDYIAIADRNNLIGRDSDHLLWQLQYTRAELQAAYGMELPFRRIINASQQQQFMDMLFRNDSFTPEFKKRADGQFELLKEYFRQEGLLDDAKTAMVDVGWLGTSRLMINRLIKDCGGQRYIFYMGVRADVISPLAGDYVSYFQPGQLDTNATALIENYFSASPYPSTGSYACDEDDRGCGSCIF